MTPERDPGGERGRGGLHLRGSDHALGEVIRFLPEDGPAPGGVRESGGRAGVRVRPDRPRHAESRVSPPPLRPPTRGARWRWSPRSRSWRSATPSTRRAASWPTGTGIPRPSSPGTSPSRGTSINNREAVELLAAEGPALVDELLVRRLGVPFNRDAAGRPARHPGGGALACGGSTTPRTRRARPSRRRSWPPSAETRGSAPSRRTRPST